jgi:hypothetical protein
MQAGKQLCRQFVFRPPIEKCIIPESIREKLNMQTQLNLEINQLNDLHLFFIKKYLLQDITDVFTYWYLPLPTIQPCRIVQQTDCYLWNKKKRPQNNGLRYFERYGGGELANRYCQPYKKTILLLFSHHSQNV